jgi:hypothetical protein
MVSQRQKCRYESGPPSVRFEEGVPADYLPSVHHEPIMVIRETVGDTFLETRTISEIKPSHSFERPSRSDDAT